MTPRVLNVGGGSKDIPLPERYDGWEHVLLDVVPGTDVDVVLDARMLRRLEGAQHRNAFEGVFCSHNLEHFTPDEVPGVLEGFFVCLREGGMLELHVPDVEAACTAVANGEDIEAVAYESPMGPVSWHDMIYSHHTQTTDNPFMLHKSGFTMDSLKRKVEERGFEFVHAESDGYELALFARRPE